MNLIIRSSRKWEGGFFALAGFPFRAYFCSSLATMKKCRLILIVFIMLMIFTTEASAQCSICTKTAQQMGERPAKALNKGIVYLAFTPLLIMGYVGYRWWNSNREA